MGKRLSHAGSSKARDFDTMNSSNTKYPCAQESNYVMSIIDEFILYYNREYDHYLEVARQSDYMCEIFLSQSGIRGIVSSRAKKPDRLRDKLEMRNRTKHYRNFTDIYNDIVDLAGTRISVYFPGDINIVRKFIESQFEVVRIKEFPQSSKLHAGYNKRFSGYSAVHFIVKLRPDRIPEDKHRYCNTLIEIQIASVLMHAWAEVEHDLIYKPSTGQISEDEFAILDELNGLVLSGEIALERLQNAVKQRVLREGVRFQNHYELAAYLYRAVRAKFPEVNEEPLMGRVDTLIHFLRRINLDTPEKLKPFLSVFDIDTQSRPIAEQLIDRLLSEDSDNYSIYAELINDVQTQSPYRTCDDDGEFPRGEGVIEFFISRWIKFESIFREVFNKVIGSGESSEFVYPTIDNLKNLNMVDETTIFELESIKVLRNDLVHGFETPSKDTLVQAGNVLEMITDQLMEKTGITGKK